MILLVDNYDSFVYNLRRYLQRLGQEVVVQRNDAVDIKAIEDGKYAAIVLSPGPQGPSQAGCCLRLVERFAERIPMLGVCLGHQVICQAFGAKIVRAPHPVHGRAYPIEHIGRGIFDGLPNPFWAARYHSLVAEPASIPKVLEVTATTTSGVIMAVSHVQFKTVGVQFHPESILTEGGYRMIMNFLTIAGHPQSSVEMPQSDLSQGCTLPGQSASSECAGKSLAEEIDCVPVVLPDYSRSY